MIFAKISYQLDELGHSDLGFLESNVQWFAVGSLNVGLGMGQIGKGVRAAEGIEDVKLAFEEKEKVEKWSRVMQKHFISLDYIP